MCIHLVRTACCLTCVTESGRTLILVHLLYEWLEMKYWFAIGNKKMKFSATSVIGNPPFSCSSFRGTMRQHKEGFLRHYSGCYCKRTTWSRIFSRSGKINQTFPSASPTSQFVARTTKCRENFWDRWVLIKVAGILVLLLCLVQLAAHSQSANLHHYHQHSVPTNFPNWP